jgi:[DsrC]-trisulfide reductase subunit M
MTILLPVIVYCVYAAFVWRVIFHALLWHRAALEIGRSTRRPRSGSLKVWAETAIDVVFFRRLFHENGLLWFSAWLFHISFFLVLVRHLKYIMNPVPGCIAGLQSLGLLAGYVLPLSIVSIALIRAGGSEKYVSRFNYFILGLVLFIGATGLLLHVFRSDLVGVKEFLLGILTFSPRPVPHSLLFVVHFLLVLLLALSLPFHLFIAPVVMHEARRREAELKKVLHEE